MNDSIRKLLNDLTHQTCTSRMVGQESCLDRQDKNPCLVCRAELALREKVVFTVEGGRSLVRDGKPCFTVHRDSDGGNYELGPSKIDDLTRRIAHLLNTYGEE